MSMIVLRGAFNYSNMKCENVLTLIDEGANELADRIDIIVVIDLNFLS